MYHLQPAGVLSDPEPCNNMARVAFDDEHGNLLKKVIRKCSLPLDHPGLHVDENHRHEGELFSWATPENPVMVRAADVVL